MPVVTLPPNQSIEVLDHIIDALAPGVATSDRVLPGVPALAGPV